MQIYVLETGVSVPFTEQEQSSQSLLVRALQSTAAAATTYTIAAYIPETVVE
jgi:hypothetical protein